MIRGLKITLNDVKIKDPAYLIGFGIGYLVILALSFLATYILWNNFVSPIFELPKLTYIQAGSLYLLCRILFTSSLI